VIAVELQHDSFTITSPVGTTVSVHSHPSPEEYGRIGCVGRHVYREAICRLATSRSICELTVNRTVDCLLLTADHPSCKSHSLPVTTHSTRYFLLNGWCLAVAWNGISPLSVSQSQGPPPTAIGKDRTNHSARDLFIRLRTANKAAHTRSDCLGWKPHCR